MSRIGKLPVVIPEGVEVGFTEGEIEVKGPKGTLTVQRYPQIDYQHQDGTIQLSPRGDSKEIRSQYGLRRTLLNNAVQGVSKGFEKGLELVGVGYRVQVQGDTVELNVGYSHPKKVTLPPDTSARAEGNRVFISGIDKEQVGEVAARIRRIRPPEPYKGKGIKYIDEQIRRKAGKSGKK
ncbi:MAG: 50S ribosomal protein L6 [Desulfohalobiaceae bacterium]|nr:50S ribosomal protein L6 [Desulfohalobiaceae bacterium]